MDLKTMTHEELVEEYGCKLGQASRYEGQYPDEPTLKDVRTELLRRLTPQPSGNIGAMIERIQPAFAFVDDMRIDGIDEAEPIADDLLLLKHELRQAIAAQQAERDELSDYSNISRCPKCRAIDEYREYDRVYFDSTPDSPSSACTPAEGSCKRCGHEWMEIAGEIEETHWTVDEIKALEVKAKERDTAHRLIRELADRFADDRDAAYHDFKHCIWCHKEMLDADCFCTNADCPAVRARELTGGEPSNNNKFLRNDQTKCPNCGWANYGFRKRCRNCGELVGDGG